ncbi:MAG: MAPEG family protein, partial [Novosphingobium sp.]
MQAQVLAPAAVLVLWSLVMLFWTAGTRLGAMKQAGGGLGKAKPGGRGQDLEGVLPDEVNWKAHNYAHLMEQPTLF